MTTPPKDNTKVEVMLGKLGRDVEELRSSEAWTAMLQVAAKFHRYSASNQLMIYMQNPAATQVAGYRQWQGMGRQVLKGEKGLKIFAPMTRKDKDDGDKVKIYGFKLVSVFDISQTEGEPLPTIEWPEADSCPEGLYDRLKSHVVSQLGITVVEENDPTNPARGWYRPTTNVITIQPLTHAGMCATLLHEAGHALDPLLTTDTERARKELVAESVAYVLGLQYGVSCMDEVTHYLASWKGGVDELLAIVDRVKQAVEAFGVLPAETLVSA